MDKRGRRCQPVGHQGPDHLTVGDMGDVAHRACPVDDPGDIQTPAEPGDDWERAQRLLRAGRPVTDVMSCHGDLPGDDPACFLEAYTLQGRKMRISGSGDNGRTWCTTTTSPGTHRCLTGRDRLRPAGQPGMVDHPLR